LLYNRHRLSTFASLASGRNAPAPLVTPSPGDQRPVLYRLLVGALTCREADQDDAFRASSCRAAFPRMEAVGIEPAKRSARTTVIEFSPQIAGPSPAIPASTPPDPVEVTR